MNQSSQHWIKIAEHVNEISFASNNIAVIEIEGRKICIGKKDENLFGFAYKCPHAGGLLAHGFIDVNGHVVCPLHRYRFDMGNGRNTSGEGYYLRHWKVEVKEDGVYLSL